MERMDGAEATGTSKETYGALPVMLPDSFFKKTSKTLGRITLPRSHLTASPAASCFQSAQTGASPIAVPSPYSGKREDCDGFILQCRLYLQSHLHSFPTESDKVAFVLLLLSGRALQWATALWNSHSHVMSSLDNFFEHFCQVFGQVSSPFSIHDRLLSIRQGSRTVSDFALEFRCLASASGWTDSALVAAYRRGLNSKIQQTMVVCDDKMGLDAFILKSLCVAQNLATCQSVATTMAVGRPGKGSVPLPPLLPPVLPRLTRPLRLIQGTVAAGNSNSRHSTVYRGLRVGHRSGPSLGDAT